MAMAVKIRMILLFRIIPSPPATRRQGNTAIGLANVRRFQYWTKFSLSCGLSVSKRKTGRKQVYGSDCLWRSLGCVCGKEIKIGSAKPMLN